MPSTPSPQVQPSAAIDARAILESSPEVFAVRTKAPGPAGCLPQTEQMLLNWASCDMNGRSHDAAMGRDPRHVGRKEFLILSNIGGIRADDGTPVALGYPTGHWEGG